MADETTNSAAENATPQVPQMKILAQYIRDLSFENIVVQKGLTGNHQPDIEVSVALDARKRGEDNQFEVIQKYRINAKTKDGGEAMFVLEIDYAGIFEISGVQENQIHPYLLIECPRMLFPYVRRIVGDVSRDGGFPALNLESVDFVKIYRQELERRAKAGAANKRPA